MATLTLPPPDRAVDPKNYTLPAGTLTRVYDPGKHGATATGFRHIGPFGRYDHHIDNGPASLLVPQDRGITYVARELTCNLAEYFGSAGGGDAGSLRYCGIMVERDLQLLDLRGNGAFRAGTIGAISSQSHSCSQSWSRWFYETTDIYGELDGIIYPGAHNHEDAFAFYERAENAIAPAPVFDHELRDRVIRAEVLRALGEVRLPIRLR